MFAPFAQRPIAESVLKYIAIVVILTATSAAALGSGGVAAGQGVCPPGGASPSDPCDLGTPDTQGITFADRLNQAGQTRSYRFTVGPFPSAAHIYVGDQWMNLDVALWRDSAHPNMPPFICSSESGCLGESRSSAQRTTQFLEPDVIVANDLEPNTSYTVIVFPGEGFAADPYHPFDTFTVRVALTTPLCGATRQGGNTYQLALTAEPPNARTSSLLTLSALVTPPYTDLFDFDWEIDGRSLESSTMSAIRRTGAELGVGQHQIRVTARGVRPYPDPDQPEMPPTLIATCQVSIT
jgi:hypothetical protein